MALLSGEPGAANVVASGPSEVWELQREAFPSLLAQHPPILWNLNRILSRRLARTNRQIGRRSQADVVALVAEPHRAAAVTAVIAATSAASPGEVISLELSGTLRSGDGAAAIPAA